MKPYSEIKRERNDKQLSRKALIPCGTCHNCGWKVPPKALWCSGACADDHAQEKAEFQARDGK